MKRRFTEDHYRQEPWFKQLTDAFLHCKDSEQMANLLRDIATLSELQAMSERMEVARLLAQGISYREIAAKTGASTTTVTRVAQFLENGTGGYRAVLGAHRHHRMVHSDPSVPTAHQEPQQPLKKSALQKVLEKQ